MIKMIKEFIKRYYSCSNPLPLHFLVTRSIHFHGIFLQPGKYNFILYDDTLDTYVYRNKATRKDIYLKKDDYSHLVDAGIIKLQQK